MGKCVPYPSLVLRPGSRNVGKAGTAFGPFLALVTANAGEVAVPLGTIFHFTGASLQFHYQLAQFGQNLMTGRASFEVVQTLSFAPKLAGGSHLRPYLLGEGEPDLDGGMKAP
jgi:hypothetical protein